MLAIEIFRAANNSGWSRAIFLIGLSSGPRLTRASRKNVFFYLPSKILDANLTVKMRNTINVYLFPLAVGLRIVLSL